MAGITCLLCCNADPVTQDPASAAAVLSKDILRTAAVVASHAWHLLLHLLSLLTPVKAVPAINQANGSKYQGLTLIRYKLADTDTSVVTTAPQALAMFSWNTCKGAKVHVSNVVIYVIQ